jgi:cell wall-associated NlpC family hydrolase
VSLSALQPGDLVFWGNPAYHVAIYIGGGRVIAAPHTGTVVQIQTIWGSPSGAVRP